MPPNLLSAVSPTMTAFKEVFNELFGATLDTEQLSDHCTLMIALSFLQCMVPISSIDASSFIGRNNRRDHVYGLEPFGLKIMPYVRTVFVRYWSQHFLRVDNPRMVSTRLFESQPNPINFDGMLQMNPKEYAARLLPTLTYGCPSHVCLSGCAHKSCSTLITIDGIAKIVRETCHVRKGQTIPSRELGNVDLQCPNRPMYRNGV